MLPGGATSIDEVVASELADLYGPLCEAMYVMMAADGSIAGAERDVIRGALRELDERVRSVHVEAMLAHAAAALASEGRARRVQMIAQEIGDDRARAEAAFLLAAAVAFADDTFVQQEKEVLNELSAALGIEAARANQLFDSLERIDDVLGRDMPADAIDVLLNAASRVAAPEDFERLAAQTNRDGVRLVLRIYATFVRSGEEMKDRGAAPSALSTARVEALMNLVGAMPSETSPHAGAVRAGLARVAQALSEADSATALRALATDVVAGQPTILAALNDAMVNLADLTVAARRRCGENVPDAPASLRQSELASIARAAVDGDAKARTMLSLAVEATVLAVEAALPSAIAETIALVLRRVPALAVEAPMTPSAARAAALPEWLPGKRTLGGFYVHRQLGKGGTATVFVVTRSDERDEPDAERFALKVPQYDVTAARSVSEAEFLKLFRDEAGALLSMPEHPNLARFITFDAGARPKPVLVMELIEGTSCDELIHRGGLTTERAMAILDGMLAGLEAMHKSGVGHLDLKPSNVVMRGTSTEPVLVDFGLAGRHLRPGCATGCYGAPEVWGVVPDGATPTPMTADVYSFGCFAFEMLTGRTLFDAPNEMALVTAHVTHDGRPPPIAFLASDPRLGNAAALLSHCLRHDPRHRPDVATLRRALKNVTPQVAHVPWPWTPAR